MTTAHLTPAEHRTIAERNLATMAKISPGTDTYRNLMATAAIHVLISISQGLDILTEYLEPPPAPDIPGLPPGWQLATGQGQDGERLWAYTLTPPDGEPVTSQHRWMLESGAVAAAIEAARKIAGGKADDEPPPDLSGLPAGWLLTAGQGKASSRLWTYTLASPGGETFTGRTVGIQARRADGGSGSRPEG